MSETFLGEIRMFGGNFAPVGWIFCDGSLLPISEYDALFNLIGTTYGGDGQETFGIPDLRGRVPIHQGSSLGTSFIIGENGGVESVTLTTNQIPAHTHPLLASKDQASNTNPPTHLLGQIPGGNVYLAETADQNLAPASIGPAGGSQPHDNTQPYLCVTFILSLYGPYPSPT